MAPHERDLDGFWGPPTATIDWCEANYQISRYIAEFWNTISNVFLIVPPIIGAILCYTDNIEHRFLYSFLGVTVVGFGSWAFHGTLLYSMQMLDELPMIWGTSFILYCLVETSSKPKTQNVLLKWLLTGYSVLITLVYLMVQTPIFHELAHAVLVFSLFFYGIKQAREQKHKKEYFLKTFLLYGFGFILWNIDTIYCSKLRNIRLGLGPMLAPILELHAWWHFTSGIASYYAVLFCLEMRLNALKKPYKIQTFLGFLPFTRPVDHLQ